MKSILYLLICLILYVNTAKKTGMKRCHGLSMRNCSDKCGGIQKISSCEAAADAKPGEGTCVCKN